MSKEVWKVFDDFARHEHAHIKLAINSNLGARDDLIDRLVRASHSVPHLEIYTSNEAYGAQAEYIRDGLKYEKWRDNLLKISREGKVRATHVMMTINALSLFSITELFDDILSWREDYGPDIAAWSINLLRFPSFMSPLILPDHLKADRAAHLQKCSIARGTIPSSKNTKSVGSSESFTT